MVEKNKRSIIEVAHAIRYDQKLPKLFLGEATNVVVYVKNRVPH